MFLAKPLTLNPASRRCGISSSRSRPFGRVNFFQRGCFLPQPKPLPRQARSILVFSTTGLGDGLFDSAAICSLKLGHPNAKLIVCAHRKRQSVALHNPCVDEVVPFGKSPVRQLRLLWRFRRERPDLVVVLHVNEEVYPSSLTGLTVMQWSPSSI